ncbi:leucine-rich repeat domain-containing protein, partial [Pseudoalteromonas carrageenovora]|uniref:leucine-rich repeat domain-containing protein n=1 Tax=Pseudoalteromonas carrageenovora TaxID=227 RepID=UPI00211933CA
MKALNVMFFCLLAVFSSVVNATEYGWEMVKKPKEIMGYDSNIVVFKDALYTLNEDQVSVSADGKEWTPIDLSHLGLKSDIFDNFSSSGNAIAFQGNYSELVYSLDGIEWKKSDLSFYNYGLWSDEESFYFLGYRNNQETLMKTNDFVSETIVSDMFNLFPSYDSENKNYYIIDIVFNDDVAFIYVSEYDFDSGENVEYLLKTQSFTGSEVINFPADNTQFDDVITINEVVFISLKGSDSGVYKLAADNQLIKIYDSIFYDEFNFLAQGNNYFVIDRNGRVAPLTSDAISLVFGESVLGLINTSHFFSFNEEQYFIAYNGRVGKVNADLSEVEIIKNEVYLADVDVFNNEILSLKYEFDINYNTTTRLEAYNIETSTTRVLLEQQNNTARSLLVREGMIHLLGDSSFFSSIDGNDWVETSYGLDDLLFFNNVKTLSNGEILLESYNGLYLGTNLESLEFFEINFDDENLFVNQIEDMYFVNGAYYAMSNLSDGTIGLISSGDLTTWVVLEVFEQYAELHSFSDTELLLTNYDENGLYQALVYDTVVQLLGELTLDSVDDIYNVDSFYFQNATYNYVNNSQLIKTKNGNVTRDVTSQRFNNIEQLFTSGDTLFSYNNRRDFYVRKLLSEFPDTDGDGLNDLIEEFLGTDPAVADAHQDFDNDGLTNAEEYAAGTSIHDHDSDNDGLMDGHEVALGSNPLLSDTDGDGVSDYEDAEPNNASVTTLVKKIGEIEFESEIIKQCITDNYSLEQSVYDVIYFSCWAQSDTAIENIFDLANFKFLRELSLPYMEVTSWETLEELEYLTTFRGTKLTDDVLNLLANKVRIGHIDIRNSVFSNLLPLTEITNLATLELYQTNVDNWQDLINIELTNLSVQGTNFTDASLINVSVRFFDGSDTEIANLSLLGSLEQLNNLYLWNVNADDWSFLNSLTQLEQLYLGNSNFTDLHLINASNLTNLDLSYTQITDWSSVSEFKSLKQFYAGQTSFSDLRLLEGGLLETLDVSETQISNWEPISGFTNLDYLYVRSTSFSDLSLIDLNTDFLRIYISNTQVEDLSPLFDFTGSYLRVSIDGIPLTDPAQLDTLTTLGIEYSGTPSGLEDTDGDGIGDALDDDDDNDGMSDEYELENGLDPLNAYDAGYDYDGDGLTNLEEMTLGTNPQSSDTDGDGLTDSQEITLGTNPALSDSDNDGVSDYEDAEPNNSSVTTLVKTIGELEFESAVIEQCIKNDYALEESVYSVDYFYCWSNGNAEIESINDLVHFKFLSDLQLNSIPVNNWDALEAFINLRSLAGANMTDTALSLMARLEKLETITMYNSQLSHLAPLMSLPNLSSLDFNNLIVEDWQALNDLSIYSLLIQDGNFSDLSLISESVNYFYLGNAEVSDFSSLSSLSQLRGFSLWYTEVDDWSFLNSLSQLDYLYLNGTNVADLSLINSSNLRTLDLSNSQVTDWSFLSSLSQLEHLYLNGTNFTDLSLINGANLWTLDLSGAQQITNWNAITGFTSLGRLELSNTNFSDLTLVNHLSLYSLDLSNTPITNWEPLSDFERLQYVYLRGTSFADLSLLKLSDSYSGYDVAYTQVSDLSPLFDFVGRELWVDIEGIPLSDLGQLTTLTELGIQYYGQPANQADFDGDGIIDALDDDDDNDGMSDEYELLYGFDPLNYDDANSDFDGDGLTNLEEMLLETNPLSEDTDNDGVNDYLDAFPLDASESVDTDNDGLGNNADLDDDNDGISDEDELELGLDPLDPTDANLAPANLVLFSDTNGDGVDDWLKHSVVGDAVWLTVLDGRDFSVFSFFNMSSKLENVSVEQLGDRNNDGIKEIGLFGFNADVGRYQLAVYNGYTGKSMGTWNWPETLQDVEFKLLEDLTLDGVQEYAITGIHLTNGTKQLFVKDGASKQTYQTFKWTNQWLDARIVQMSDITNDGVPEVALYGRHERLDKGQLFVFDGANSNTKLD